MQPTPYESHSHLKVPDVGTAGPTAGSAGDKDDLQGNNFVN